MSWLHSIPSSWTSNFSQRRRGDPRQFINRANTKAALWASKDVYYGSMQSQYEDWKQTALIPVRPLGTGQSIARLGGGDLRMKVYHNEKTNSIMIAFEGTRNMTGVWQDVQMFRPIRADFVVPGASGQLHSGFAGVYQGVREDLQKIVAQYPTANVLFTGHSLGGAVASIASADQWPGHQVETITVGAPQVGDQEFARWYGATGHTQNRILQKSDPVTIGNLKYVHADDGAWVIGQDNAWVDFSAHGIHAYIDQAEHINSRYSLDDDDGYIYREAHAFATAVDLGKDIHRAYKYYQAAQEFYEYTQLASGLPQTGETLRQIVFTQDGVLAQGFQTTIDKLQHFNFPTRDEFKQVFVNRIADLQEQADVIKALDAPLQTIGSSKFVDVKGLVDSGLADIAPDVIRPLSNVDVLTEGVPLNWADDLALATSDQTILAKATNVFAEASDSASNYFKLLNESDAVLGAKSMIKTATTNLDELARPLTSGITNIWAGSQGVRSWVTKAVPKAMSVGGFLLNALSFGSGIADIAHGDKSALTIAGTTIAGLGTIVAGIEAAAAVGVISSSVLTASLGAGITIPVVGQILAVAGLITFAIAWFTRPKRKSQQELEDERNTQIYNFVKDSLVRIGTQAYGQGVDIGFDTKNKTSEQIGQEFYDRNKNRVTFNTTKNQLEMAEGGPLVDLIYPPIHLANGQVLHADDPDPFRQAKVAQEAYKILHESGLVQGTSSQFVTEHYKDFGIDTSILKGEKGGYEKEKTPQELKDQTGILYKGKPFQDYFLPEMHYRGQRVLPSENPKLYQQVQLANNIWDGMEQFGLGDKTKFVDHYAAQFEMNGEQITIQGKDFKDAIFPPLYGITYSQNPGAYENMALSKHLYQELTEADLSTGGLSEREFVGNYFSHIDLDDKGNIKIDGIDAMDYYYDPITDLNGKTFFRYQDPEMYDKAQAFYRVYDDLNDKYKKATGKLLTPIQLWQTVAPSIQMLSGHQMAFGLTPHELQQPEEQMKLLAQVEQRALDMGIPIDQKQLQNIRTQIDQASFNDTQGNGFHLSEDNVVLLGAQPLINHLASDVVFNGRVYHYNDNPKGYLNMLQYRTDPKMAKLPQHEVDAILDKTIGQVRLPDSRLSSYSGYLTKSIGPVSYSLPEPQVVAHAFAQLDQERQQAYQEYQADVFRLEEETRKKRLDEFEWYANPMENPEPVLRAVDRIYDQMIRTGVSVQMTKDEFDRLYAPALTFDNNGTILVNGKANIPLPIPIPYEGRQVFQVQDPSLYQQLQAANTVFDQLVTQGSMTQKDRSEFVQQYQDKFQVASSGEIEFQGKVVGQTQPHPNLNLKPEGEENPPQDPTPETEPHLPNVFDGMKDQIKNPQAGFGSGENIQLPTPNGPTSMFNPLQSMESKMDRIQKPLYLQPDSTKDVAQDAEDLSAMYPAGIHNIPGAVGFQPNGEKLKASLNMNLWVIHFENGESDTYPRQRNLMGYTLMGNWIGATPLANGGPINTLDSYMLAYHIQSKYSVLLASGYLKQRCQEAINQSTINPFTDVREFNIAQEILSMPQGQNVWDVEAVDRDASYNLSAQLQQKMSEVFDHRIIPASLPTHVDRERLLLIPQVDPQENMLKRCIEATGILQDFQVQNKLRKVLSDYQAYETFSEEYMKQVSVAQGDVVVPNMKRQLLEGIIARDEIVEEICNEWVRLISQPIANLFEIQ